MLMDPAIPAQLCPQCQNKLVTDEPDEPPWCERCQWNLEAFKPDEHAGRLRRRLERLDHRWGFGLSMSLHRSLAGGRATRPGVGKASLLLAAITGALLALMLLLMAFGFWLIIGYPWPAKILGGLIVLLALLLRPRLGRLKPILANFDEVTRDEAPALFGLIDRVGAEWNAFATTVGLRRTRVLLLGLPYFHCRRPQERVAVLGHEMGHFANGDLRTGLLTRPALETFGILAELLYPDHGGRARDDDLLGIGFVIYLAESVLKPVMYLVSYLFFLAHLGTNMIGARQSQRAEHYADELAARVAGSEAAASDLDLDLSPTGMVTVLGARSRAGLSWREGVEQARADGLARLPRRRQLSLRREASVFASHPPTGLRRELIAQGPHHDARVVLTEAEAERIDAELAGLEKRYRRTIAHSW
jgi:heat shock protein HtpX